MTPPESQAPSPQAEGGAAALPAVSDSAPPNLGISVLKTRREFLACAKARKAHAPSMMVQGRIRRPGEAQGIRVGFTCSKKIGNAVARNRAKRRLREAARAVLSAHGRDGWDYVLVGRPAETAARPFDALKADLEAALAKLHHAAKKAGDGKA